MMHMLRSCGGCSACRFWHGGSDCACPPGEQLMAGIGAFLSAEEQEAARAQGEVEHLQDFALHFAIKIDQQRCVEGINCTANCTE